jgi:glycosyltransferase involved in cell wall biosynthesis
LTASSPQIADAVAAHYGVRRPTAIHNTFSLAERQRIDGLRRDRRGDGLSLYWFSQTIGLDRGLQDAIKAVGLIDHPLELHLRGSVSDSTRDALCRLARACGAAHRLFFHSLTQPAELLSRAAEHDVGLALEQPVDGNKGLTASNKLFVYLLAGLAVAATDLPGQHAVMASCAAAGELVSAGDYQNLATVLARWCSNPAALRASKTAALAAAHTTWNWEAESQKFVASVRAVLG